ncbi:hypothetical protein WJX73_008455 [Symbiochloris irregularis]|uniref:Uncharacterized protein n=1 Tax=Symbiochloris irregularis TaxID=706552 RepID=A0AAW1P441_9CHLO
MGNGVTSLHLERLTQLTSISISGPGHLTDLKSLAALPHLRHLQLGMGVLLHNVALTGVNLEQDAIDDERMHLFDLFWCSQTTQGIWDGLH